MTTITKDVKGVVKDSMIHTLRNVTGEKGVNFVKKILER
jgi:hypothetical protein